MDEEYDDYDYDYEDGSDENQISEEDDDTAIEIENIFLSAEG